MAARTPILVLVTMQRACARLIRVGADMAMLDNRPLLALHVASGGADGDKPAIDAQVLNYLYALAGEANAEMSVVAALEPVPAMADFAREHGAGLILMGDGDMARGIAEALAKALPGVEVRILEENATIM